MKYFPFLQILRKHERREKTNKRIAQKFARLHKYALLQFSLS